MTQDHRAAGIDLSPGVDPIAWIRVLANPEMLTRTMASVPPHSA